MPRTGAAAEKVNAYGVVVNASDASWSLLVDGVEGRHGVTGRLLERGSYSVAACVPFTAIDSRHIEISHWYGKHTLEYRGLRQYVLEGLLGWDYLLILKGWIEQVVFNRRPLARIDRISLLRTLVTWAQEERSIEVDPVTLLIRLYPRLGIGHPDRDRVIAHNRFLLEALHAAGDLESGANGFRVCPIAYLTLEAFEEDERRHRENLRVARAMRTLTAILIVVSALQVYASLYG